MGYTPRRLDRPLPSVLVLVLLLYAVPYGLRTRALARAGRPVPAWRVAAYAAALAVLGVALSGPVDALADRRFAGHMAEHLAIGDVAPLLLVIGCSGPVLAPLLRRRPVRALRRLAHPLVALPVWALTLYAWHLPALYDLTLRNDAVHALEHTCFLVTGLLLWTALLGPLPKPGWFGGPARLGYITAAWLASGALGGVLAFGTQPFYAHYEALLGRAAAVDDQSVGGALMLVEGTAMAVTLFCWAFLRYFEEEGERQELVELAAAAGMDLTPARVARAVDAGAGETLRRRIAGEAPGP